MSNEFTVNSTTANSQINPRVTVLNDGRLLVVWSSDEGGGNFDVRGRILNADGTASSPAGDFVINTTTAGRQDVPSVAVLTNGNFVVTWSDVPSGDVYARMFNSSGAAIDPDGGGALTTAPFIVNTTTAGTQDYPRIAALSTGGFVITWEGPSGGFNHVFSQAFGSTAAPIGSEVLVSSAVSASQNVAGALSGANVAGLTNGNYVVTWQYATSATDTDVAYRLVAPGVATGPTLSTNAGNGVFDGNPSVGMLTGGGFALAWSNEVSPGNFDIFVSVMAADGSPLTSRAPVNTVTAGLQGRPALTGLTDGSFIVTWRDDADSNGVSDVKGRIFSASGVPVDANGDGAPDPEFIINTTTPGILDPENYVAALPNGGFASVWVSGASASDIHARTFSPPVAIDDTRTVSEDVTTLGTGLLGNDSDADGGTLTVVAKSAATAHGAVNIQTNGSFDYTPAADYFGPDSFTYTVTDGIFSRTATVTVTVTAANDAPTAANDSVTVLEDSAATTFDVVGNDSVGPANESGQVKTVTAVTQPTGGSVTFSGGNVTFTPNANFNGSTSFTYTMTDNAPDDGAGNTSTATVNVTVTAVNDNPDAVNDSVTVNEDSGATVVNVLANDTFAPDTGETLTVTGVTQPASGGSVTLNAGVVSFTPTANFNGATSFTYTISDGNGGSDTASVNVTVTGVNDNPDAIDDTVSVAANSGANVINVLANDTFAPDSGETLTVSGVTQPASGGSVALNAGTVSFTPNAGFTGPTSFTYTISDGNGGSDTATVNVTVTAPNNPPTATDDSITVAEDSGATVIDVLANDSTAPDTGETLTVATVTQPVSGGSVTLTGGVVRFTPSANFNGPTSFDYTVSDGNGGTDTGTVNVTVNPVNDNPDAVNDAVTVNEDSGATVVNVLANDTFAPDTGETLTVTGVTQPASGGSVTLNAGVVSFTPTANFNGATSFTYTISDGNGGSDTASVNVTVTGVNDNPDAIDDTVSVAANSGANVINVLANDTFAPDSGETLTVSGVTQPASGGSVALNAGTVSFTPNAGFTGPTSFTYTISDGNGGSDTATVNVTVTSAFVVTTLTDELDASDTVLATANLNDLSLREALALAAQNPGADIIRFAQAGTITINPALEGRGGNFFIAQNVTIDGDIGGDGTSDITIDGNDASRLFYVDASANATLSGLTLQNGLALGGNGGNGAGGGMGAGGAVFVASGAQLRIEGVDFSENAARGGNGGGRPGSNPGSGGAGSGGPAFGPGGGVGFQTTGGTGGFGGGGGGVFGGGQGGTGGFGGGAGAGGGTNGSPGGVGGFGGGNGGNGGFLNGTGGGGAGFGGALFVQDGATVVVAGEGSVASNQVFGGNGNQAGAAAGSGIFLQVEDVTFAPSAGKTITVSDIIADATDSLGGTKTGEGPGGLIVNGAGTLTLGGANTYSGGTTITAGVLSTSADANLGASSGGLTLHGGTLQATASYSAARSVNVAAASSIDITGSNNLTLTGSMSGTGLTKTSGGTLTLNGTGYGGTVTIAAGGGTLSLAGPALTSAANIITLGSVIDYANGENNPATITISSSSTQLQVTTGAATQSGNISETGGVRPLEKIGAGALTLSGTNTYTGTTTISAGTLTLAGGAAIADAGAMVLANTAGVVLNLSASETIGSLAGGGAAGGNVTLNANTLTVDGNNTTTTFAGVISGAGSLAKQGSGALTLSATNAYQGGTSVTAGRVIELNNGTALSTGTVAISSGAVVELSNTTGGTIFQNANTFTGTGTIQKTGAGILAFGPNGAPGPTTVISLSAGGLIDVQAGTLIGSQGFRANWTSNQAGLNIASGAIFNGSEGTIRVDALTGAGTLQGGFGASGSITVGVAGGSGAFSGTLSNTSNGPLVLIKEGAGTQTLSGTNTYTGTTTINAGTLQLGSNAALGSTSAGTTAANGTIIDYLNAVTIAEPITLATNATVSFNQTGGSAAQSGAINGAGNLVKTGTGALTLSGSDTYTGTTTVNAGTLTLAGGAAIADTGAVVMANAAGAILNLTANETIGSLAGGGAAGGNVTLSANTLTTGGNNSTTTFSGVISGTGSLAKSGSGAFTLTGTNTYTGGTTVTAGRVVELNNGTALSTGTVAISSGAVVELSNTTGGTIYQDANTFTGAGTILKTGAGTTAFGPNGAPGPTTVISLSAGGLIEVQAGTLIGSQGFRANWTSNQAGLNIVSGAIFNGSEGAIRVDALTGAGTLQGGFGAIGSITVGVAGGSGAFSGTVSNNSAGSPLVLIKEGAGTQTLSGTNTYTGSTTVNGGTLIVDGSITSATTVNAGGALGGHGTVGAITISAGGTLSPGNSPGILHSGALSLGSGSTFKVEIAGATPGTGYDQMVVTGSVSLGGATLSASLLNGFNPDSASSANYTLIDNDLSDAVSGTFAGLVEGAQLNLGGYAFTISYHGGSGNDVVLMAVNDAPVNTVPGAQTISEDTARIFSAANSNLISISDVDVGAGTESVTLTATNGTVTLSGVAGLSFVTGDGTADATMTLSGTTAAINAALNGLTFTPSANFNGAAGLTITTNDNGNTGSGGAQIDSDSVAIAVTAVNDAPVIVTPSVLDLVTANWDTQGVSVWSGDGAGGFGPASTTSTNGSAISDVAVGDFNGDGRADVVTANGGSGTVTVLLNNGAGGFNATRTSGIANGLLTVAVGDVNGDGRDDIITGHSGAPASSVHVLLNNGAGGFTIGAPIAAAAGSDIMDIAVGDMNGDGRADVVSAGRSNDVNVFLNTGSGLSPGRATPTGGSSTTSIALGDIDGDGWLDAVTTNTGSNDVSVLRNDGAGGFNAPIRFSTGGSDPWGVVLGDVNGDGRLDAVVANQTSNTVSVLLNNGLGGFVPAVTTPTGGSLSKWIALGDVNRDGRLDAVVTNQNSNSFTVLLNNGRGTFDPGTPVSTGVSVASPVLADVDNPTVAEDTALVFSRATNNAITVSDDANGSIETASLTVSHGTLTLAAGSGIAVTGGTNGTGAVTFTGTLAQLNAALDGLTYRGNQDYNGADNLTVTVNDNGATGAGGALATMSVIPLTITPVNDAPVAVNDTASTNEDTSVLINVLANDTDVEGNSLSIATGSMSASHGTAVIQGNQIRFTPDTNYNGPATVNYRATDGLAASNAGTVAVAVNAVNDAPAAVNDTATTNEDTSVLIDVLANDTDVESTALTLVAGSLSATNGTAVVENGQIRFTPDASYNGLATVTYRASDGDAESNTGTVSVTVNAVNDAPVAVNDTATTNEDTSVLIDVLANDTDVEGTALTLVAGSLSATNGTAVVENGQIRFTPDANYNGPATIAYRASDGDAVSNAGTVSVTVNAVNDAPVAVNDTATTNEDTSVLIDVLANDTDVEGTALTLVAGSLSATNGTAVVENGQIRFTPDADYNGPATINYRATDGSDESNTGSVAVTVNAVNDAPVAVNDTATTNEDTSVLIDVLANDTDVEGTALTIVAGSLSVTNGTAAVEGNQIRFTPNADYNGPATISYRATDGSDESSTGSVAVTVNAVNDAPVAVNDTATTNEDTSVLINVLANDTDVEGAALTLVAGSLSATNGTAAIEGNQIRFTPDVNYNGPATISYRATDGSDESNTGSVAVTVNAVNDAPVAVNDTATTNEDTSVLINVLANDTDVEGTALTLVAGSLSATNGTAAIEGNQIRFTPDVNYNGPATISYRATDGSDESNTGSVAVTVNAVNDAPQDLTLAAPDASAAPSSMGNAAFPLPENSAAGTVVGILGSIDPDDTSTTYSLVDDADGLFALNGTQIVLAGALDFEAASSHQITVRAADPHGAASERTFTIVVGDVDEAPTAITLSEHNVIENSAPGTVIGTFSSVDPEGGPLTYVLLGGGESVLTVYDQLVVTGPIDFEAQPQLEVTIRATDSAGNNFDQDFVLHVVDVIEPAPVDPKVPSSEGDSLQGGPGADALHGGDGDDFLVGRGGGDILDGGPGSDTIDYATSPAALTATLIDHGVSGGDADGDSFSGIENVTGSGFADLIVGDDGANVLLGLAGNDTLVGLSGNDTLEGSAGADVLIGQDGADTLRGGANVTGFDELYGGAGNDVLEGGDDVDFLAGGLDNDTLHGGGGGDALHGQEGNDTIYGEDGDDVLLGQAGDDALFGGAGNDTAIGHEGSDLIEGGAGNDQLFGYEDADTMSGGLGDDFVAGGAGNDTLHGNEGGDVLDGEADDDVLFGGAGGDNLNGNVGNDMLFGGAGNDGLLGHDGNDVLDGGPGNDFLIGDQADGSGNRGNDIFVLHNGTGNDNVADLQAGPGAGDIIDIRDFGFQNFEAVLAAATDLPGGIYVQLDADDAMFIEGLTKTQLATDDFLLA